jgi:hypothetical protein
VLLCIPWLKDIIILLDSRINGKITKEMTVIYQQKKNAMKSPTIRVIKFSMIDGMKFPAKGFKSSQFLFIIYA